MSSKVGIYKDDIITFLENEYVVPDSEVPIRFDGGWEWQRDILKSIFTKDKDGKRIYTSGVISTPRQQGKSLILQCIGLYTLIAGGRNLNIYSVACDLDQAALVPERVKRAIQLNPRLSASCQVTKDKITCPVNGNTWHLISSDEASAPGIIADALMWDELGMLPEHQWGLFYLLLPAMVSRREPIMVVASTIGESEEGPLHDLMALSEEKKDEHTYLYYTSETKSPLTNQQQIERDKLLMPEAVWQRHYRNVIVAGSSFLSDEDIESIIIPQVGSPEDSLPRFVGCDWGLTKDKCATVSIAKTSDGDYVWADAKVFQGSKKHPVDLNEAADVVRGWLEGGHIRKCLFDKWQAVSKIQELQSEYGSMVEGYDFSQISRKRLFQNLFTIIRNRKLKLYSDSLKDCWQHSCQTCIKSLWCQDKDKHEFLRELTGLRCDSNFNVSHGKRGDDITIALGLSLLPAVEATTGYMTQSRATFNTDERGVDYVFYKGGLVPRHSVESGKNITVAEYNSKVDAHNREIENERMGRSKQ